MGVESSIRTLHALFVDPDGRRESVLETLDSMDEPIEVRRVPSVSKAKAVTETERVDCLIVQGVMETDDERGIDGIGAYERAREEISDVPVAVYDYNWDNDRLKTALSKGIKTVKGVPERPELIYRQLRSVAGMEADPRTDSELLESLFAYYPHQLFLKDDVGRFEGVSDATAREYDLTREEMIGLTDYDVLDPETATKTYEEEQVLLESGEADVDRIKHYVDERGRDRWVSITKAPRYDETGKPVGIVGSSRDVTGEKRKESMVRELHAATQELVRAESKGDIGRTAMQLTEDIPVVSRIQVALLDDTGETLEPLAVGGGESLFDTYQRSFAWAIEDGAPQYVTADGRVRDEYAEGADITAAILPLDEHGAIGLAADAETFSEFGIDLANILASSIEATLDRAERERELERQNERLEEFASIVSHDLRNPLNVASAATELLEEGADSENVDRIRNALGRMEQLIEALLTLARKGQIVGESQQVAIGASAEDSWQVVDAPEATLTVETSGVVATDRDRLVELLENLFRNAVDHGGADVSIRVGVRDDRNGFYVADDGPGIDTEERDQVFAMGYSDDDDGTGYGLYIVSTIAQAHGWTVSVADAQGGGARFDVTGATVEPLGST